MPLAECYLRSESMDEYPVLHDESKCKRSFNYVRRRKEKSDLYTLKEYRSLRRVHGLGLAAQFYICLILFLPWFTHHFFPPPDTCGFSRLGRSKVFVSLPTFSTLCVHNYLTFFPSFVTIDKPPFPLP